jgi:quinol monooxygenase YgiN
MLVKVLIKRRFVTGKREEILSLLKEFRSGAMDRKGYISGETLVRHDDPQTMLVIGTWESMEDWHRWKEDKKRKTFEAMLEVYQEGPTEYEEFILGVPLKD